MYHGIILRTPKTCWRYPTYALIVCCPPVGPTDTNLITLHRRSVHDRDLATFAHGIARMCKRFVGGPEAPARIISNMLVEHFQPLIGLDQAPQQGLPAMDVDDCLLAGKRACNETGGHVSRLAKPPKSSNVPRSAGDDSSWKMSDWQWDPKAFRAKPVVQPDTGSGSTSCCKKRRTDRNSALQIPHPACGGCKARSSISLGLELTAESRKAGAVDAVSGSIKSSQQVCAHKSFAMCLSELLHLSRSLSHLLHCSTKR